MTDAPIPETEPEPNVRIHTNVLAVQLFAMDPPPNAPPGGVFMRSADGKLALAGEKSAWPWIEPGDSLVVHIAVTKVQELGPQVLKPKKGLILPPGVRKQ